jgi:hypothetical protein
MAPPSPRRKPAWPWILGCGCLGLLVVLGGGGYTGYRYWQAKVRPRLVEEVNSLEKTAPTPLPEADKPTEAASESPAPKSAKPAVTQRPSKEKAIRAALAETKERNWVAKVAYAAADWQRVKVWVGPPNSEYTTAITLQWDTQQNLYNVVQMSALPSPGEAQVVPPTKALTKTAARPPTRAVTKPPTTAQPPARKPPTTGTTGSSARSSADGPVPSARRAIAKVLAKAPEPGWVGKVTRRSADYTEVTVMIGPPQSEFVAEMDVRWDWSVRRYNIVARRSLGEG